VKELVVISGKGGTGKTSVVASFAALARQAVLADCDVDAADLHIVLEPRVLHREDFSGGKVARIDPAKCTCCGACEAACRFGAVLTVEAPDGGEQRCYSIDELACEGCGVCAWFCPEKAVDMIEAVNGEWYISETRHGPMAHARLNPGGENSGKLVTVVREKARELAKERGSELIICDGSPGIGCPVIASLTGADMALVVTEPTASGSHDLERVADLTAHFDIPTAVCINKHDLNPEITAKIEARAEERGIKVLGRICYDTAITEAQMRRLSTVEHSDGAASREIKELWERAARELEIPAEGR